MLLHLLGDSIPAGSDGCIFSFVSMQQINIIRCNNKVASCNVYPPKLSSCPESKTLSSHAT